jgi:hypothetical protein
MKESFERFAAATRDLAKTIEMHGMPKTLVIKSDRLSELDVKQIREFLQQNKGRHEMELVENVSHSCDCMGKCSHCDDGETNTE